MTRLKTIGYHLFLGGTMITFVFLWLSWIKQYGYWTHPIIAIGILASGLLLAKRPIKIFFMLGAYACMITAFVGSFYFGDYLTYGGAEIKQIGSIREHVAHPERLIFEVRDQVVAQPEFGSEKQNRFGKGTSETRMDYFTCPLTGPDWQPGDSVYAWIYLSEDAGSYPGPRVNMGDFVYPHNYAMVNTDGIQGTPEKCIEKSTAKFGLKVSPLARLFWVTNSPEEAAEEDLLISQYIMYIIGGLWLFLCILNGFLSPVAKKDVE